MNINFLILYLVLTVVTSINLGFYSNLQAISLMILIPLFFLCYFRKPKIIKSPDNFRYILTFVLLISFLLSYYNWFYFLRYKIFDFIIFSLIFIVSLIFSLIIIYKKIHFKKFILIFIFIILLSFVYRIVLIQRNVNPQLDGYQLLKQAPVYFAKGINPYTESLEYPLIKLASGVDFKIPSYSYGITPLFVLAPIDLLFSEPRYLFLIVELLSVYFLYKILNLKKNNYLKFILPVLFYWHPLSFYVIAQGFLELLMLFFLILFAYIFLIKKKEWGIAILVLLINIKQNLFIAPLFFWRILRIKRIFAVFFISGILLLPFYLTGSSFMKYGFIFGYFDKNLAPIRLNTLTFNSIFFRLFGNNLPSWFFSTIWICALGISIRFQKSKISSIFYSISFFYLILSFFSFFSYTNYFYFISLLLLVGISLEFVEA